jgi:RNA polymerase sigma factor (sigma-70 family)
VDVNTGPRRFKTTRWSVIRAARDRTSPAYQIALTTLCETYWHPAYAFVRRSGYNTDDARDLTQAFFARMLEKQLLKEVRQNRGRFRSFLLASLRNFLSNEYDWRHALKRGGHSPHQSLEFGAEEQRYQLEPTVDLTPEDVYERRWASGVLETAMHRVAQQHEHSPRRSQFERLRQFLADENEVESKEVAAILGMSDGAFRVALSRLRKQYKAALRQTIAETVNCPDDVDDELRHLMEVVSRVQGRSS